MDMTAEGDDVDMTAEGWEYMMRRIWYHGKSQRFTDFRFTHNAIMK